MHAHFTLFDPTSQKALLSSEEYTDPLGAAARLVVDRYDCILDERCITAIVFQGPHYVCIPMAWINAFS